MVVDGGRVPIALGLHVERRGPHPLDMHVQVCVRACMRTCMCVCLFVWLVGGGGCCFFVRLECLFERRDHVWRQC